MDKGETHKLLEDRYLDFYALAYEILRDDDDARDAVQEAIVRSLNRPWVDDMLSYCFQTVRHNCIDTIRRRFQYVPMGTLTDSIIDYTDATESELLNEAARLRDQLPCNERLLVELHDQRGYTYKDIAALTGMSAMSVRRRLKEIHLAMKKRLIR